MNQNMNQIRARHVLAFANDPYVNVKGQNGGEVVKKIPAAIMNSGLLSSLAYAMDEKNKGWKCVFDGIAMHLSSSEIGFVDSDIATAEGLLEFLTAGSTSSDKLREVSVEAMAWLDFARRLVK